VVAAAEAAVVAEIKARLARPRRPTGVAASARRRHRGTIVDAKRARRVTREQEPRPQRRRRWGATTGSDRDGPIVPNAANGFEAHGAHQLWAADTAFIALIAFHRLRLPRARRGPRTDGGRGSLMDAWSRRVVGDALDRKTRARLVTAALQAAVEHPRPLAGLRVPRAGRGGRGASKPHRALPKRHGFVGSMSRRANPCHNAAAESLITTRERSRRSA
jgi:putative transposase